MIPLRAETPRTSFAVVTILLIALNVGVFFYQISLRPKAQQTLISSLGVVPARTGRMIENPARYAPAAIVPLFTSMFLHGGWLHLLGNMLFLWVFGGSVEGRLGHGAYLIFYLFCGLAAGVTHIVANWGSLVPSIGASGAISGVMGAYIVLFPASRILTLVPLLFFFFTLRIPAVLMLGYWFGIQFLSGISTLGQANPEGVAWWAHIGGFVVGAVFGVLLRLDEAVSRRVSA
jgi:membrane associated rhomboid family serine protease